MRYEGRKGRKCGKGKGKRRDREGSRQVRRGKGMKGEVKMRYAARNK